MLFRSRGHVGDADLGHHPPIPHDRRLSRGEAGPHQGGRAEQDDADNHEPRPARHKRQLIVDLDRQRAYIYSQKNLVAATRIASGKANYRTSTGDYKIGQKNPNHASNLYGKLRNSETGEDLPGEIDTRTTPVPEGMVFLGAPMPHFMRFHTLDGKASAIGFHQGHVPSRPASHGCIRLPSLSAKSLYKMLPSGIPIFVYGSKYGTPSRPLPEVAEAPELKRKKRKS